MYICDVCRETGQEDCIHCSMGDPCLGCHNYDEKKRQMQVRRNLRRRRKK